MSDTKSGTHAAGTRPLPEADVNAVPAAVSDRNSPPTPANTGGDASSRPQKSFSDFEDCQETVISQQPPIPQGDEPRPFSPLEMGAALQGQKLGHFELEQFVGGGGMGAVFRARDTSLDRTVAVKVLSRDQADPDIHRRFRNEAQSAARLDHDNISRVFYVGQDKGWNYIVFEYVDGKNVRDVVADKGPLPVAEAVSYTVQVAEALEHAYRRDVVHRDIKPSNLLITPNGHIKLVDMGLARLHQVETPESDLTASGVTLGTFDYISPEQARDPRVADVRSDLYSLGCTLYFMLTGRPPFPEGTVLQKLLSHTSDERPDPRLYRPDLPEEIAEVLNKLLARRPEQRYQEPNELIGELLLVSSQLGIPNPGHGGRVWVTQSAKQPNWVERLAPIVLPLALLLLAVWGLDAYLDRGEENNGTARQRYLKPSMADQPTVERENKPPEHSNIKPTSPPVQPKAVVSPAVTESKITAPENETTPAGDQQEQLSPVDKGPSVAAAKPRRTEDPVVNLSPLPDSEETSAGIAPPSSEASLSDQVPVEASLDGNDVFAEPEQKQSSPAPAEVRRLIVGEFTPAEMAGDAAYYRTLGQAVLSLEKFPNLEIVELRFDGPVQQRPFQMKASDLTIQAGEGFRPVLSFSPAATDLANGGQMIRLAGGDISWLGVQLEMTLPEEASSGGWSLFELHHVNSLNLRDSTMTIRNAQEDGTSRHPNVAFFRVSVPPSLKMMAMPGDPVPMPMTPVIDLRRCIARGEATLIRMPEVTPIRLNWHQGMLATGERLLEAYGAARMADRDRPIEIDLIHVTATIPQGMCRLVGETDAQNQPRLDIESTACIFLCNSDVPIIEHTGVRDVAEVQSTWLRYRGDNFYPTFDGVPGITCWRIVPLEQPEGGVVLASDVRETPWWDGTVLSVVKWHKSPASEPVYHRHLPDDYRLIDGLHNPPIQFADKHGNAGFDIDLLPSFYAGTSISRSSEPVDSDAAIVTE